MWSQDVVDVIRRTSKIEAEIAFWHEEQSRIMQQCMQGTVTPAFGLVLNAVLMQLQILRKEAYTLLITLQKEQQRIIEEQNSSEIKS
jgi:hypothetical protein